MLQLTFGLTVALIGMGTVFVALILLVFFIDLMSRAMRWMSRPKVTAAATTAVSAPSGDDGELPAVIAAAIEAYRRGHGR